MDKYGARGPTRAGIPYNLFGIPRNPTQNQESCLGIWNLQSDKHSFSRLVLSGN